MTRGTNLARRAPLTENADTLKSDATFNELLEMGTELVKTGFLPDTIKNGAQAAAIIMAGRELGIPPMRALRSIVLVKGRVTEYADSQLSRFKTDGGKATFTELTDSRAELKLTHPNGDTHTELFTLDDARKAGLLSSSMYSKFPKAMLRSRVITAGLKSVGWEGGAGVYDPAELAEPSAPQPEPKTSSKHVPAAAETAEPAQGVAGKTAAPEGAVATPERAAGADDAPSGLQRELLSKLLRSHVFTEAEVAHAMNGATTQAKCTDAIEWAQKKIAKRTAVERAKAVAAGLVDPAQPEPLEGTPVAAEAK